MFIDIEWSQPTNVFEIEKSQILQIAGIGVSQDGTETRRFARSVCPTNPDEVTSYALELIGAQLESLLRATEKDVVINNFFTTFKDIKNFVVWNKNAYDLLMYEADRLGIKLKKHNVIIVQDLIRTISKIRCITFEKALDMLKVEHNKSLLHHSKYDVEYLLELSRSLSHTFAQAKDKINIAYYRTQNTGITHGSYCGYISNSNTVEELSGDNVLFVGRLCSCCVNRGKFKILKLRIPKNEMLQQEKTQQALAEAAGVKSNSNELSASVSDNSETEDNNTNKIETTTKNEIKNETEKKSKKKTKKKTKSKQSTQAEHSHLLDMSYEYTEENINRLSNKYNMDIRFGAGDILYVDSGKTKWRIYFDDTGVERVYHENYIDLRYTRQDMNNTKYKKSNSGFHKQKVKSKSLEVVLRYIKKHDENFVIKFKKTRVDYLLDKIADR